MRLFAYFGALLLTLCLGVVPAEAGKRLALVIGNSKYENVTKLPNPANDAADIAAKLTELGFEVEKGIDLTREQFSILVSDFRARVRAEKAEDVVFYYAGHAFNLKGINQFVPVEAKLKSIDNIPYETLRLDDLLNQIQVFDNQKTVVLLDACRNSPLPPSLQSEDLGVGLSQLQTSDSSANALVVFATLPNQVTKDGKGRNSPFARALLQNMGRPGESIDEIFPDIRKQIVAETDGTQKPFKQGSPPELFYFNPDGAGEETDVAVQTPQPPVAEPEPVTPEPAATAPEADTATAAPQEAETPSDVVELSALAPKDGELIIGEEVAEPSEPSPPPQSAVVEAAPEVVAPKGDSAVDPVAGESQKGLAPANPDQTMAAVSGGANALAPAGTSEQGELSKDLADAVAPAVGSEIASNGSAAVEARTEVASIDPQQGRSAVEESLTRSAAVTSGGSDSEAISAGQSEALTVAQGGQTGKSVVASLSSDVIAGIEVADDSETPAAASPPPQPAPEVRIQIAPVAEATPVVDAPVAPVTDAKETNVPAGDVVAADTEPQKVASVDPQDIAVEEPQSQGPVVEAPAEPSPDVIRKIQQSLKQAGCFGGDANGEWGSNSQLALERYLEIRDIQLPAAEPSQAVLDEMTVDAGGQPVCVAAVAPQAVPDKPKKVEKPDKPKRVEKPDKPKKVERPASPKPAKPSKPSKPSPPPVKPPPKRPGPIVIIGG